MQFKIWFTCDFCLFLTDISCFLLCFLPHSRLSLNCRSISAFIITILHNVVVVHLPYTRWNVDLWYPALSTLDVDRSDVDLQYLHYTGLGVQAQKDPVANCSVLSVDQLPHIINPIEAYLGDVKIFSDYNPVSNWCITASSSFFLILIYRPFAKFAKIRLAIFCFRFARI